MPRKNSNTRPKPRKAVHTTVTRNPTTEQLARNLVTRGLCTPQILETSTGKTNERNNDDQE
jgi:hypothetical protein